MGVALDIYQSQGSPARSIASSESLHAGLAGLHQARSVRPLRWSFRRLAPEGPQKEARGERSEPRDRCHARKARPGRGGRVLGQCAVWGGRCRANSCLAPLRDASVIMAPYPRVRIAHPGLSSAAPPALNEHVKWTTILRTECPTCPDRRAVGREFGAFVRMRFRIRNVRNG